MWAELAPIGRDARTGGYRRLAWTPAERECRSWFYGQAQSRGLIVDADGNGNEVAWWFPDGAPAIGGVVTGSHLDSVPDGGGYDGPLGIVSAFAAIDQLRSRGVLPTRPIGVAAFADEEGSRFGIACLGSRLLTGAVDADRAAALRDGDGRSLPDAMRDAGFDHQLGESQLLGGVAAFVELHVEQGRALADVDAAVGIATEIWPHGRWRFDIDGEANHAGTTPLSDRHDPMLTYAETALATRKKALLAGAVATFGRIEVLPNAANAIPSCVRAWLDARAPDESTLHALIADLLAHAVRRADRDGTALQVTAESISPAVSFAGPLTDRIRRVLPVAPLLPTGAGHDAGILAAAGIPTAMLFVRNPTGISHAPAEAATETDCLAGVDALAGVFADLAV
ncbi:MAG: allantoate amidohydrolase [Pseudonocardiales bacterium]|nr:MAG: allantoate amidohydrolase [Pseudonocardiales bacterium]